MTAIAGMGQTPGVAAIKMRVLERRREALEKAYIGQAMWQMAGMLGVLAGGAETTLTPWTEVFPLPWKRKEQSGGEILREVLQSLERQAMDRKQKEESNESV